VKVYEAMADAFVAEGSSVVFGMMGDANMHWMNALHQRGVRLYEVRHEGSGLGMADGWARAAGRPGVLTATSGPGTSQLATSMIAASRAGTPLVAMCGEVPLGDEGAVQYLDQRRFAAAIEAVFVQVSTPALAHDAVQRAFFVARAESRPVMLSAPTDVQQGEFDDDVEYVASTALLERAPLEPNPARIREAAELIGASEKVVIVVGRGARDAGAGDAVLELQRRTGALLATTLQVKNWLRDHTPYYVGISGLYGTSVARDLLQDADCVIALGASLNRFTTEAGYLYPEARYVQFDRAPQIVLGHGARADCYVRGDALLSIRALLDEVALSAPGVAGFHTPEVAERIASELERREAYEDEPGRVDPREAIRIIDAELPTEVDLVLGSGHQTDFGTMGFTRARETVSNYGMFGAIGQAPLIAMGWIVARGNRPTVVVEGDASFIMHLEEFETACRYRWPILVVVMNDEGLGAEFHKSAAHDLDPELSVIPSPELGAVAVALGGSGATVRSIDELRGALRDYAAHPAPTVIDVRITRRVLSVPYRRLWYAEEV
jgi:thiamine pyrophosphate-dependent acetolactate synthase large subunit-like protein